MSYPITVVVYHRNGNMHECQFRTREEAEEYMSQQLQQRWIAECEWYA